ncbi:hypothetical protein [Actinoplanes sp. NBRC 103695]|uniref:hypothetical protein n=1 Tax=Actinoplanes sp. NBRC 103695 TaxID=3032202 RepID=UPI0024A37ED0|nr:hypothetical protein [Actinoplanes sp. NBRC 103695]GLY97865.1 hypothetical protein Acsp02_51190 [Actinoplanes sp. NBRC 103695]
MNRPVPSRSVRRRLTARATTVRPVAPRDPAPDTAPPDAGTPTETTPPAEAPEAPPVTPAEAPATPRPDADALPAGRWRFVILGLVVLLTAVLVGSGLSARDVYDRRRTEDAHQQATAAARQAAVDFMSISAATVDADIERITGRATGDFRDEFTRGAAQVRKAVLENKVDAKGTVLRTGLVDGDTRTATVLVAVDATVKNKGAPNGRLSHYRVRVGLTKDGQSGRWLVSQLQFVG